MKTLLAACCLICFFSTAFSQTPNTVQQDSIFVAVDQQAEFTGGIKAMTDFLRVNISYPSKAKRKRIQGKVFVKFIVEKNGTLTDIEVLKGTDPLLDQEALRVVSVSPAWIPAQHKGEIVRSQFILPIQFVLD